MMVYCQNLFLYNKNLTEKLLTSVAAKTLDRKRRLGKYAVVYRQGKSVIIESDYDEEFIAQIFDDAKKLP
jgi:hypothetical protein